MGGGLYDNMWNSYSNGGYGYPQSRNYRPREEIPVRGGVSPVFNRAAQDQVKKAVRTIPVMDGNEAPVPKAPVLERKARTVPVRARFESKDAAARKIQAVYRGYCVRKFQPLKHLKVIKAVKGELDTFKNRFQETEQEKKLLSDSQERDRWAEGIMALLLRLDSLQGVSPEVRLIRKALSKELLMFQETIDTFSLDSAQLNEKEDSSDVSQNAEVFDAAAPEDAEVTNAAAPEAAEVTNAAAPEAAEVTNAAAPESAEVTHAAAPVSEDAEVTDAASRKDAEAINALIRTYAGSIAAAFCKTAEAAAIRKDAEGTDAAILKDAEPLMSVFHETAEAIKAAIRMNAELRKPPFHRDADVTDSAAPEPAEVTNAAAPEEQLMSAFHKTAEAVKAAIRMNAELRKPPFHRDADVTNSSAPEAAEVTNAAAPDDAEVTDAAFRKDAEAINALIRTHAGPITAAFCKMAEAAAIRKDAEVTDAAIRNDAEPLMSACHKTAEAIIAAIRMGAGLRKPPSHRDADVTEAAAPQEVEGIHAEPESMDIEGSTTEQEADQDMGAVEVVREHGPAEVHNKEYAEAAMDVENSKEQVLTTSPAQESEGETTTAASSEEDGFVIVSPPDADMGRSGEEMRSIEQDAEDMAVEAETRRDASAEAGCIVPATATSAALPPACMESTQISLPTSELSDRALLLQVVEENRKLRDVVGKVLQWGKHQNDTIHNLTTRIEQLEQHQLQPPLKKGCRTAKVGHKRLPLGEFDSQDPESDDYF